MFPSFARDRDLCHRAQPNDDSYPVVDSYECFQRAMGQPVTVIENCKQSTGKTCTFWRTTDRIIMDGEDRSRTLATNTSNTCVPGAAPVPGSAPPPTTTPGVTTSPPK